MTRRRVTSAILAGLAACCAAGAVILSGRLAWQVTARPLGAHETATLTATGAAYLSPTSLTEVTGAGIDVNVAITPVTGTGYPGIAIWDMRRSTYDTASRQQLEPTSRTVVFDRATARLVNCCGGNIDGNALIRQAGIAGWAFPVGARKQAYDVFDPVLGKPEPATYSGTETVDGIVAYKFTQDISGADAGFSALSPDDPQRYSMHRVYWVDPQTGMLLNLTENEDLYLTRPAAGPVITHLFRADLRATQATVRRLARQDARHRHAIALAAGGRRALSGLAALLALLAGCLLARWRWTTMPRRLLSRARLSWRPLARRLPPSRPPGGQ
jgi:hypothetical protein